MPKAVIYGPLSQGGLNYPQFKTIQTTQSITCMIKQLRWNKDIAKDIRVSIEIMQLMSGLEYPLMEHVEKPVKYVEKIWILIVRERLRRLKASIHIENIWFPKKQRDNDISIMEKVISIKGITKSQMGVTNMCRVYLRIIVIFDLANISGNAIPLGRMLGQWRKNPS